MTFCRCGAGQRGQLRLGFAIENRRNGRRFALLAREHGIETFLDQHYLLQALDELRGAASSTYASQTEPPISTITLALAGTYSGVDIRLRFLTVGHRPNLFGTNFV